MAKRSKAYLEQAAKIDQDNLYSPLEAAKLGSSAEFGSSDDGTS